MGIISKTAKLVTLSAFLILGLSLANSLYASAASLTWGSPTDGLYDWSDINNWGAVDVPQDGDSLTFSSAAATSSTTASVNDITSLSLADIILSGSHAVNGYVLSGEDTHISSLIRDSNSGGNSNVIAFDIVADAHFDIETFNTADLTLSGGIQLNNYDLTISNTETSNLSLEGTINGSSGSWLIITGDGNATTTIPDTTYMGRPINVTTGGQLLVAGTIASKLHVTGYGKLKPQGCVEPHYEFKMTGGYLYLDIENAPISGRSSCMSQSKVYIDGTVSLQYATLVTKYMLDDGYFPSLGSRYVIVSNDGTDKINGTFKGLPEGDTFTVGARKFRITYKGGTGNDAVITRIP